MDLLSGNMAAQSAARPDAGYFKKLAPRPLSVPVPVAPVARNHYTATSRQRSRKPRPIACQSCRQAKVGSP